MSYADKLSRKYSEMSHVSKDKKYSELGDTGAQGTGRRYEATEKNIRNIPASLKGDNVDFEMDETIVDI